MSEPLYGIFGGTFDPIHNGHLETVQHIVDECAMEQVVFVPAASPPHRSQPHASARQRLDMVALAITGFPRFAVDDRELQRNLPSYTYDTVKSLQADFPHRRYCFIIGIDALAGLENWYCWQDLLEMIHFVVMGRPGWHAPDPLPGWWRSARTTERKVLETSRAGKILEVAIPPNLASATEIRYGISQGFDVGAMMPAPVWQYICQHNLYMS